MRVRRKFDLNRLSRMRNEEHAQNQDKIEEFHIEFSIKSAPWSIENNFQQYDTALDAKNIFALQNIFDGRTSHANNID